MTEAGRPEDVGPALERLEQHVSALHEEVRRLGSRPPQADPLPAPSAHAWLGRLDVPARRRPQLPRVLLESLFLVAAAAAAAIADLEAVAIAGVMIGAWVLVALIEWAASRADSRREEIPLYAPAPVSAPGADPAWFSPPVEQTLLDAGEGDSDTAVTRLPPPLDDDADVTVERRPAV
jgi:hypothetical protein